MNEEKLIAYALEEGFAAAVMMDTKDLVFDPSFRPYCEENLCGQYDANYSCPPSCGSPEAMKQKVLAHRKALVLQTIWEISDYSDKAATKHAKSVHNASAIKLMKYAKAEGCDGFLIGASGCALCSPCAITRGEPCKFPDLQYSCVSAYCIFAKKMADACGIEYDCGPGLISFFGLYVFD